MMKRILLTILMLTLLPAVLGVEFSLTCPDQPGEVAFSCTIDYSGLDPDNFGGFDFTVQVNGLTLNRPTTTHGSLQYNQNTGSGALVYDYAGLDASGTMISLPLQKAADAGDSGTVTVTGMVLYDIDSNPTDIPDASAEVTFAAPPVEEEEEAGPPPPPPAPGAPGAERAEEEEEVAPPPPPSVPGVAEEEEEAPAEEEEEREDIPRAPLTEEQLAPEADADGDGEANVDDEDDDGDDIPDEEDLCSNTYLDAERVADDGCLEGDLGGAEDDASPDGCVNSDDISAADFLQRLLDDGLDGLSSLLWGMFDNWNAGEGTC